MKSERDASVYRYYDADDRLLYIGMTEDEPYRWSIHRHQSRFAPFVARREVGPRTRRCDTEKAEAAAIRTEAPLFNIQFNPDYDNWAAEQYLVAAWRALFAQHDAAVALARREATA